MTRRLSLMLVLVFAAFANSPAQLTPDQKATSERILTKIRLAELYNQVLPVLMTSDQIKALLPILERHRADAIKLERQEHDALKQLEVDLDKALTAAKDKGSLPDEETLKKGVTLFRGFMILRKALVDDTVDLLKAKMKEKLNEGQLRAAGNAFNPAIFLTEMKLEDLTDDIKLDYWIRVVLMDNATYDILLELSRKN